MGIIHNNQSITSFFNMGFLNINNHIKSSLEFVHSGTVVFLRYFGPFSNQRPFQSLHTRVCNRTGLCLQKRLHTEVHGVQTWEWRRSQFFAPELREMTGAPLRVFFDVWEGGFCWTFDFCVWSLSETKACSVAHTSVEGLKRSLVRTWAKIS